MVTETDTPEQIDGITARSVVLLIAGLIVFSVAVFTVVVSLASGAIVDSLAMALCLLPAGTSLSGPSDAAGAGRTAAGRHL